MTTAYVTGPQFALHTQAGHPENVRRLEAIDRVVSEASLYEQMLLIQPQSALDDDLQAVHSESYLSRLADVARRGGGMLDSDTYVTPHSDVVARLAAGSVVQVVDSVLGGKAVNGLAAVRPPGHHALPTQGMGFCLMNNVAIAARHAQRKHGLARIAIVDYDVHHGNGTQDIFYSDPTVLYVSIHQSPLFPGTGPMRDIGTGDGKGFTVNIPLPSGVGDSGYARVFDHIVLPVLRRFEPDLLLVAAGFDAHWLDPLANMTLTLAGYAHILRRLVDFAAGACANRVIVVLEGGYHLEALAYGWADAVRILLGGANAPDPLGPAGGSEQDLGPIIGQQKQIHRLY